MSDWRTDPGWRLASWRHEAFKKQPGHRPPKGAELAQPPIWASLYGSDGRLLATWHRPVVQVGRSRRS